MWVEALGPGNTLCLGTRTLLGAPGLTSKKHKTVVLCLVLSFLNCFIPFSLSFSIKARWLFRFNGGVDAVLPVPVAARSATRRPLELSKRKRCYILSLSTRNTCAFYVALIQFESIRPRRFCFIFQKHRSYARFVSSQIFPGWPWRLPLLSFRLARPKECNVAFAEHAENISY